MSPGSPAAELYDRDGARRLLEEELRDSAYQRPLTGPLREAIDDAFAWLGDRVFSIGGFDVPYGPLLVLAAVIAAAVITILVVRPRLQRASGMEEVVDIDPQMEAELLRSRAWEHAQAGNFNAAAKDAFRALVRDAEERGVVPVQKGRTATEIARALSASHTLHAEELQRAAEKFNRSAYGSARLTEPDYHYVSRLDVHLQTAAPGSARTANGPAPAAPR